MSGAKKVVSRGGSRGKNQSGLSKGAVHAEDVRNEPSVKELLAKIKTFEEELGKERKERNYFQLQGDKVLHFWEVTKKELEDAKAQLRNKDREMEELEERHQVETKVYKQKVKHLLYEHQNYVIQLKTEGEKGLKLQSDEQKEKMKDQKKVNKKMKEELREIELAHEDVIKNMKQEHDRSVTKIRQEFERQSKEMRVKYDKKMKQLREDLEVQRKNEIHEIEERKNAHINDLMKKHDRAFQEIKAYYNDIFLNNLDLIKMLKEQVEDMKKKEADTEKLTLEVTMENKRLSEPLQKALKEVAELRKALANYDKDKQVMNNRKTRLNMVNADLKNLQWEHEVLEQRFIQTQKERDELYEKFVTSIQEVQAKSGLKSMLLEKKLAAMSEKAVEKEVQLNEIAKMAGLDPQATKEIKNEAADILDEKNVVIKELESQVTLLKKKHNDMIRIYETKLVDFGIPKEELGFELIPSDTTVGPAGLL